MSARFEVVHTGPRQFHARWVAGNGETVWVTESYTRRRTAHEAIAALRRFLLPNGAVEVREVDER